MKPYREPIVTVAMQVAGLEAAISRFRQAAAQPYDPAATYLPLFESLNWIAALDERVGKIWRPRGGGRPIGNAWRREVDAGSTVEALAWARNLIHHQWADALNLSPVGHGMYPSPTLLPGAGLLPKHDHAWVWRPVTDLPPRMARNKKSKDATKQAVAIYVSALATRPVIDTLVEVLPDFVFVAGVLEPPAAGSSAT